MIISNARIITWEQQNRILDGYAVKIKSSIIEEIGKKEEILSKGIKNGSFK